MSLRAQFSWPGRRPKAGRKTIGCFNRYLYELFSGNLPFIIERRWVFTCDVVVCISAWWSLCVFVQIELAAHTEVACVSYTAAGCIWHIVMSACARANKAPKSGTWPGRREVYVRADRRHAPLSHITGWWQNQCSANVKKSHMEEGEERKDLRQRG